MNVVLKTDRRASSEVSLSNPERRAHDRRKCRRPAELHVNGFCFAQCVIKDISAGGAKLLVEASEWMPWTFEIFDTKTKIRFKAQRVWNRLDTMGVKFLAVSCE